MEEKRERSCFRPMLHWPVWEEDFLGLESGSQTGLSISEDDVYVYVEADLPGLKSEDIEVSCEKGVLWIRGEKKEEEGDKKKKYYRKSSKSFSYRVQLPGQIDEKKEAEAVYKNGVVRLSFAKAKESQAKKIKVK